VGDEVGLVESVGGRVGTSVGDCKLLVGAAVPARVDGVAVWQAALKMARQRSALNNRVFRFIFIVSIRDI
jgi:hypothetical protein